MAEEAHKAKAQYSLVTGFCDDWVLISQLPININVRDWVMFNIGHECPSRNARYLSIIFLEIHASC